MRNKWLGLTIGELIEALEPYSTDTLVCATSEELRLYGPRSGTLQGKVAVPTLKEAGFE